MMLRGQRLFDGTEIAGLEIIKSINKLAELKTLASLKAEFKTIENLKNTKAVKVA